MKMEVLTITELHHSLSNLEISILTNICLVLKQVIWDQRLVIMEKIMAGPLSTKLESQEITCFKNSFKLIEKELFLLKVT